MNAKTKPESNKKIIFYFQIHQPRRLRKFQFFDIGTHDDYFDDRSNEKIVNRIAKNCYLPTNDLLLKMISKNPEIKISFSISGVALDQFATYCPEVIDSFRALADTGSVEFLSETNYHSLACLISEDEFHTQILQHAEKIYRYFGVRTTAFRNTELIYNNAIGEQVARMGFNAIICDDVINVNPYTIYEHPDDDSFKILLRNNRLSDDIAFRFIQDKTTLTVDQYTSWLYNVPGDNSVTLLGLDYETFGEHRKKDSGIGIFLENLIKRIIIDKRIKFAKPSSVLRQAVITEKLSVKDYISWADEQKDLSAWLGNDMQTEAFNGLKELESIVKKIEDPELANVWRNLQTSDHFYYMSTKTSADGSVHSYFSPYSSPYEAFINYMNILNDFRVKIKKASAASAQADPALVQEYERRHTATPLWAVKLEAEHKETFVSK
ncbi:MAG TPA: glycoside hydrolase family 57 protein [Cyclobacteriaceae bacterium]